MTEFYMAQWFSFLFFSFFYKLPFESSWIPKQVVQIHSDFNIETTQIHSSPFQGCLNLFLSIDNVWYSIYGYLCNTSRVKPKDKLQKIILEQLL